MFIYIFHMLVVLPLFSCFFSSILFPSRGWASEILHHQMLESHPKSWDVYHQLVMTVVLNRNHPYFSILTELVFPLQFHVLFELFPYVHSFMASFPTSFFGRDAAFLEQVMMQRQEQVVAGQMKQKASGCVERRFLLENMGI